VVVVVVDVDVDVVEVVDVDVVVDVEVEVAGVVVDVTPCEATGSVGGAGPELRAVVHPARTTASTRKNARSRPRRCGAVLLTLEIYSLAARIRCRAVLSGPVPHLVRPMSCRSSDRAPGCSVRRCGC
jgi:hypothetical protein